MKNEIIHIRRWAATVIFLAALVGGGLLASSVKNWTGHAVVGAAPVTVPMAKDALPISLGAFHERIFFRTQARASRGRQHSHLESREAEAGQ